MSNVLRTTTSPTKSIGRNFRYTNHIIANMEAMVSTRSHEHIKKLHAAKEDQKPKKVTKTRKKPLL